MKTQQVRDKDRQVLMAIVEDYLKLGKPVSSGSVVRKLKISVSPATVRNIMARFEKNGYLYQPHASAGRIPTDKGLRFYVNSLLEDAVVPKGRFSIPREDFSFDKGDVNSLFIQASNILSDYSENLGFVISPRITKMNFRHLRFIKISEEKVLIILVTSFNLALTEIIKTGTYFTQLELDRASQYLNENFRGKSLTFVQEALNKQIPRYRVEFVSTLKKLTALLKTYFLHEESDQIFIKGTSRLLEKSDLFDMERLKSLFYDFEEKTKLAKLLSDFISLDRVKVLIGSELGFPEISDCSLILSHYGYDQQILGSLGIIGPKQLSYKKIIPLVDFVAQRLSQTIKDNQ